MTTKNPRYKNQATLTAFVLFIGLFFFSGCCCPETIVESYAKANLPTPNQPGHLSRVSDDVRGLWMNSGSDWFSLSGEMVNPREFGAQGDGLTDDTRAIQEALEAGSVFLPPGIYIVQGIHIPTDRTLIGVGSSSILKLKEGSSDFSNVLAVQGVANVSIRNLSIDGNGNNVLGGEHSHNIYVWNSTDVHVNNVILHDAQGDGISIGSDENSETSRISVRNCHFYNRGRGGITVVGQGASDVFIINNQISLGRQVTTSTSQINGIHIELSDPTVTNPTENLQILGNIVREGGISVNTEQIGGQWRSVRIVGNEIDIAGSTTKHGILLTETANFTITDNIISGDADTLRNGINIHESISDPNTEYGIIANNVITNMGSVSGNGILLTSDLPIIESKIVIQGNIIKNIARRGILVNDRADNILISDNIISGTGRPGIELFNSSNFIIKGNRIEEATGAGISLRTAEPGDSLSNGMVKDNIISFDSSGTGILIHECENCLATVSGIVIAGNDVSQTTGFINIAPTATDISVFQNKTFAASIPVFPNGDQTPTVRYGNITGTFVCANTSPITITNFEDAVNATEIEIHFTTANTTIDHGNNIVLSGGTDLIPIIGTILRFRMRAGVWYQL